MRQKTKDLLDKVTTKIEELQKEYKENIEASAKAQGRADELERYCDFLSNDIKENLIDVGFGNEGKVQFKNVEKEELEERSKALEFAGKTEVIKGELSFLLPVQKICEKRYKDILDKERIERNKQRLKDGRKFEKLRRHQNKGGCSFEKENGKLCTNKALRGTKYCKLHGKKKTKAKKSKRSK